MHPSLLALPAMGLQRRNACVWHGYKTRLHTRTHNLPCKRTTSTVKSRFRVEEHGFHVYTKVYEGRFRGSNGAHDPGPEYGVQRLVQDASLYPPVPGILVDNWNTNNFR